MTFSEQLTQLRRAAPGHTGGQGVWVGWMLHLLLHQQLRSHWGTMNNTCSGLIMGDNTNETMEGRNTGLRTLVRYDSFICIGAGMVLMMVPWQ